VPVAVQTGGIGCLAAQFNELFYGYTRGLLEIVDVLGDGVPSLVSHHKLRNGLVACVWLGARKIYPASRSGGASLAAHLVRLREAVEPDRSQSVPNPPGLRQSGILHSMEMPPPVNDTV